MVGVVGVCRLPGAKDEERVAEADDRTVGERDDRLRREPHPVDIPSVPAAQVEQAPATGAAQDAGVLARHSCIADSDIGLAQRAVARLAVPSDDDTGRIERDDISPRCPVDHAKVNRPAQWVRIERCRVVLPLRSIQQPHELSLGGRRQAPRLSPGAARGRARPADTAWPTPSRTSTIPLPHRGTIPSWVRTHPSIRQRAPVVLSTSIRLRPIHLFCHGKSCSVRASRDRERRDRRIVNASLPATARGSLSPSRRQLDRFQVVFHKAAWPSATRPETNAAPYSRAFNGDVETAGPAPTIS